MLNVLEKSEMKSALSAQMCRLESPSRSVESEPENVLNTASPGRCSSWILPHEMMATPDRPTTAGLQSPSSVPVQFGPSPQTQEYCRRSPRRIPPAQWGNHDAREDGGEECELFRDPPQTDGDPTQTVFGLEHEMAHQDGLDIATAPSPSHGRASNVSGPRCINGQLLRPEPPSDDAPSTACNSSSVIASGGARLGKAAPPCFGAPPGSNPVPSRRLPPPPPPPSSSCSSSPASNPAVYPPQWTLLNNRPKSSGGGPPDGSGNRGSGSGGADPKI